MVMVMSSALAACGGDKKSDAGDSGSKTDGNNEQAQSDGDLAVNVILKTTASEYWGYVVAGCEAYGKDHPEVKVNIQGASSETAYDEQLNIIETNLASGQYDGYVIAPLQADMVVKQIAGEQKPIIAVDTDIDAPEVLSFVGTGNETAAYEGGKVAVEMAKEAGWKELKAISISGVEGDSTATARLTGYEKGITEAGGEFLKDEIQYADAVADKAYASMEAVIQNHPEGIAMIVCNNDDMALGAIEALKAEGYNKGDASKYIPVVGVDATAPALQAMKDGSLLGTVLNDAENQGKATVNVAIAAAQGKEINKDTVGYEVTDGKYIWIDYVKITQDNYQDYLK